MDFIFLKEFYLFNRSCFHIELTRDKKRIFLPCDRKNGVRPFLMHKSCWETDQISKYLSEMANT